MTEKQYRLNKWGTRLLKNNRPLFGWMNDSDEVVDLLNELNDKCEFLEIENESLEDGATRYAELYHKSLKENKELKKENKKLKKVIEEDGKLIQSIYDELTKLRRIKKNLEIIKAKWDWIMEAIQYD